LKTFFKNRFFQLIVLGLIGFVIALTSLLNINVNTKELEILKSTSILSQKVKYYDEVLTMSSRMAAYQDEKIWQDRYYNHAQQLDETLFELMSIAPYIKDKFQKIENTNKQLVLIEQEALKYASNAQKEKALSLLFSDEYKDLKQIYSSTLEESLKSLYLKNKKLEEELDFNIFISYLTIFLSIGLINISAFLIFKELVYKNKKINQIFDLQTSLVVISTKNKLINLNKRALIFFGYKNNKKFKDENKDIADFFIMEEGYLKKFYNGVTWVEYILGKPNKEHHVKMRDLEGNVCIFQVRITSEKIIEGGYIISFTDVTELRKLQEKLENEVKEQVESLSKKDLILVQQSKMASLGEMLENIAHQWKQPLSVIATTVSGIKFEKNFDKLDDASLDASLDNISNSTHHLVTTMDVFRDFFKNEKPKEFSLLKLFNKAQTLLSSKFKNKGIELILNIDDLVLVGKENELIQVIMNILSNAVDELEKIEGKKLIKVFALECDDQIRIEIVDNAGGIESKYQDKIFKHRFTTKENSGGTGIGLYMSQLIIEKARGSIEVKNTQFEHENNSYKGANFIINLPKE